MSNYHFFPMQYEPIEGENLRVKVDIDHSTFSIYLKKLDITQMSLHKCVDFAQTLLDDVTLEVSPQQVLVKGSPSSQTTSLGSAPKLHGHGRGIR
ncbi:unnamed protein product [Cylindrotheca closterium]|uniref:Uncharacterized protein n=1 Tax=Cylindrotheca closterium TaxID=2856 RepID=A0AAD2G895_9STRA|nr:unnamed protein product [Cylindrotheca closterium]